ncbi:sugar ABC transporter substrate-binding protein [Trinickia dinghuensis]|uniref:Sugar ABC transporter substrate-binding protein n=2 Tax=Trinickia dinghuensis TaxID=2291023 RepID=A0A3D8K173_9BURK|nr:sugar ABC transporter substrate-binding protein [Trinickia dinghuensis]RDU98666.1 sugar ABC transporter substrate-binding protein [Trinickia dinghuensis]
MKTRPYLAAAKHVMLGAAAASALCAGAAFADQPIVGLITKTDTNPFFVKMKQGAEAAAQKDGAKLLTAAGRYDGDNSSQVTALENMTTAGAKAILITPSDTKAIVPSIEKARKAGVMVIALDTPTDPQTATDGLFATNNFKAGELIGAYAKKALGGKPAKIATLDLAPGISVGILRHDGFLKGFGIKAGDPSIVCSQDTRGDQSKGQAAMENCLQKSPDINVVYTINEPAAAGAYRALQTAGKEKNVLIVSIDGGCEGVRNVKAGEIAATAQQYPLKMAAMGVDAGVNYAKTGKKVSGYTDTGVTLITDKPMSGVDSKDTAFGLQNCWGQ